MYKAYYHSPLGWLEIVGNQKVITQINFVNKNKGGQSCPYLSVAIRQLQEYFAGQRTTFSLRLKPTGTVWQRKVWQVMAEIPYGYTASYAQLASLVGRPRAARAIGGAVNKNPIPIILPCHRIVGSNGQLVGYAGGLRKKKKLLDLEG